MMYYNLEKLAYKSQLIGALSGGTLGGMYGYDGTERGDGEDPDSFSGRRRRNALIGAGVGAGIGGALGHLSRRAGEPMIDAEGNLSSTSLKARALKAAVHAEEKAELREAIQELMKDSPRAPTASQGEFLDRIGLDEFMTGDGGHPNERLRALAKGWMNRSQLNTKRDGPRGFYMTRDDLAFINAERLRERVGGIVEAAKQPPTTSGRRALRVKMGMPPNSPETVGELLERMPSTPGGGTVVI